MICGCSCGCSCLLNYCRTSRSIGGIWMGSRAGSKILEPPILCMFHSMHPTIVATTSVCFSIRAMQLLGNTFGSRYTAPFLLGRCPRREQPCTVHTDPSAALPPTRTPLGPSKLLVFIPSQLLPPAFHVRMPGPLLSPPRSPNLIHCVCKCPSRPGRLKTCPRQWKSIPS